MLFVLIGFVVLFEVAADIVKVLAAATVEYSCCSVLRAARMCSSWFAPRDCKVMTAVLII